MKARMKARRCQDRDQDDRMTGILSTDLVYFDLPDEIFKSRDGKHILKAQPKIVDFKRLLKSDFSVGNQIPNKDLLHSVVALYEKCLPTSEDETFYDCVCGKWSNTLLIIRDLNDASKEIKERYQASASCAGQLSEFESDNYSPVIEEINKTTNSENEMIDTNWNEYCNNTHTMSCDYLDIESTHKPGDSSSYVKENSLGNDIICLPSLKSSKEQQTASNEKSSDAKSGDVFEELSVVGGEKSLNNSTDEHVQDSGSSSGILEHLRSINGQITKLDDLEESHGSLYCVYSDSEESESSESSVNEDFSIGSDEFITAVKKRREARTNGNDSFENIGPESVVVGCATFQRSLKKNGEKVMQLTLLAVRKRYRKMGIAKYMINMIKDWTVSGSYSALLVYAENHAVQFFKKHGFDDDVILSSMFDDGPDEWINSVRMTYLPPYTSVDKKTGFAKASTEMLDIDEALEKWRSQSLQAYQVQTSCLLRMKEEIITLKAALDVQNDMISHYKDDNEKLRENNFLLEKELHKFRMMQSSIPSEFL